MPPPTSGEDGGEGDDDEGGEPGPGRGKDIVDVVVGMTQILGRNTIFRANYSVNQSAGYLNDPYKIMSVVQDRNSAAPGEPVDYIYENRPDSRRKQAVFGEVKRHIAGRTLTLSYRHFWDDWGIKSNTAEVFLRMPLVGTQIIEPHFRWYRQSKSVFFSEYLIEGQRLPQYGSADSRLSAFDAYTAGLLYIKPLGETAQLRLTAEYYTQRGTRAPPEDFGVLSQHGLFPELDVIMLRVGYSIAF
jgi:hypothetical protein